MLVSSLDYEATFHFMALVERASPFGGTRCRRAGLGNRARFSPDQPGGALDYKRHRNADAEECLYR